MDEVLTFVTGNRYLSRSEMETNARYIYNYLGSRGWSVNAIAGMLGNFQSESTVNPGIWQSLRVEGDPSGHGYGLVQWTPYTKYTNWCAELGLEKSHMDTALQRIEYELENGLQWIKTSKYPMTFAEFKVSEKPPYYLGMAFVTNYERPAKIKTARGTQAEEWYTFLTGLPAPMDPSKPKTRKGLPLWLMYVASRRRV